MILRISLRTCLAWLGAMAMFTGGERVLAGNATDSLLSNGSLEASSKTANSPDDWALGSGAAWEKTGSNHFLRLKSPAPGANISVYRAVKLSPAVQALELKYKVRYEKIQRGKQAWFDGRIMMNFKDAGNKVVEPGPKHPSFNGTSAEWKERTQQFRVPKGATQFELIFALFQAESGQIDFDDITLAPLPLQVIEAAEAAAQAKEMARIARMPKPAPQVPVPAAGQLPPELRVEGNQLKTIAGDAVWLQGLAIPSMEWSAGGENILKSIETGITEWKANCIRLPVREHFWAGQGPYQNDGGAKYRQLVEDAINLAAGHGVYLIIDLHDYRAPREKHAIFWKDVAMRYKNHPAVIFELLNEPHDISWEVWRNGGKVIDAKKTGDVVAENAEALNSFDSIGMQKLLDVIRETGAKNIVIAGGLDWGYDLSGILTGSALEDRTGNGIVYSSHVYPWKNDWQGKFLAAAEKHPILLGEVGADTMPMPFIPKERLEDPAAWVPDMLGTIQKQKLHWTAWCFHPKATPRVILDWSYTPTPFWGEPVKQALKGASFEAKRLR